jgi:hypothetical protein
MLTIAGGDSRGAAEIQTVPARAARMRARTPDACRMRAIAPAIGEAILGCG